ncbi:MAG: 1-acyl-sn-glycerol-3-phosphate acyltransferase [Bacteroidota bacterium]|nr:1-acyl-sn-glycerol-3-phosphate acyltransferase [Bacteroidota bacterium]
MKNWPTGYEIIRSYVRFAFRLTHKRVVVTGRHLIPKGKPIIFAANHQNALMDPLAIACTNPYQTVWLARADLFKSKTVGSFLKYLKLLPIYRIRDGKENLSNNEQIFEQVTHILEKKETIALFPEAAHSGKRQMLPHKKAIPRIALEAEEKNGFNLYLQIVPVGIFYTHYWDFNRSIIVQYGEPIGIDHYQTEYAENPQKAMISLRDKIYSRISSLTIDIKSNKYYQEYENISHLVGQAYSKTHFFNNDKRLQLFHAQKEVIDKIEQIEITDPKIFDELINETSGYFGNIHKNGVSDMQVRNAGDTRWSLFLVRLLAAFLFLPLFVFGFVFNAIPHFIPRMFLRQKVKDTAFLSTFIFVTGLIFFPLFYLFCASLIFRFTGSGAISIIAFMLMPVGGKIAFELLVFYRQIFDESIFLTGSKSYRNMIKRLLKQRTGLIKSVLKKVNL